MTAARTTLLLLVLLPTAASATPVLYTSEAAYLAALAAGGYGTIHESFENAITWGGTRTPSSASSVTSQGILWASNFSANGLSTSTKGADVHDGTWALYSNPHGDQTAETSDAVCDVPDPIPPECFLHDGFRGTSSGAGTLYGVGGWIDGTFGANVILMLDGVPLDFGAAGNIYPNWTFLGAIDSAGFTSFEYQEVDGKGGQAIYIFGDDFNIGVASLPAPSGVWLLASVVVAFRMRRRRT